VILRSGKNARTAIDAVKAKLAELQRACRTVSRLSNLRPLAADRPSRENLTHKLIEEFIVVAVVCGVFLWHLRSAGVAIISLPLASSSPSSSCAIKALAPTSCPWGA